MNIVVLGAGAIGSLVAGYLTAEGEDVLLVGHPDSVNAIRQRGLEVSGVRGPFKIDVKVSEELKYEPDLLILATKTQDVDKALKDNRRFLKNAVILTTQNGVQADSLVAKYTLKENIVSSIVMFGATYLEPGKVVHNFEGPWIIGKAFGGNDKEVVEISEGLNQVFPAIVAENIKGMKYLKIFVNANNCIPAVLGTCMQEAFSDINISKVSIAVWKEGLDIVNKAGVKLESLPDFPLERLTRLTSMPEADAAKVFSGIMNSLSKEPLYGSILQSIKRGRASEIDYINGEFVRLAKESGIEAPLNEKLVEMVHCVEQAHKYFSKDEVVRQTNTVIRNW